MRRPTSLHLHEEIMLLALHDKKGTVFSGATHNFAIGGAVLGEQLVRRGILCVDQDKVLGIFTRTIYPEVNPTPEREVIERLREAVFGESGAVDPRTVVLLSLAASADLLKHVFDRKKIDSRRARIEQIVNGELSGRATKEAIAAMQAAVMVACIIPAIVASAASAH